MSSKIMTRSRIKTGVGVKEGIPRPQCHLTDLLKLQRQPMELKRKRHGSGLMTFSEIPELLTPFAPDDCVKVYFVLHGPSFLHSFSTLREIFCYRSTTGWAWGICKGKDSRIHTCMRAIRRAVQYAGVCSLVPEPRGVSGCSRYQRVVYAGCGCRLSVGRCGSASVRGLLMIMRN